MSYQVLARKWRPATFDALVGQEHVLQALRHALDSNRLHHAYLFTGTRGVGKTTIARILARALNCEQGVSANPCGVCGSCVEISEGRSVDLIEVDAASRTKVEDTRELLDNVQYAPTRSRFKVYLIDEVHMLSGHSFNALLKTLEEPPEHVKFLLATTDPQKLPATVLSRCLQFNLKNMTAQRVAEHLRHVLTAEGIEFDEPALWQLGRSAAGSMRDALSLTDQAIAFGSGALREAEVASMLGSVDRRHVYALIDALLADDAPGLLQSCAQMDEQGVNFAAAVDELCSVLHRCAIAQAAPAAVDQEFGDAELVVQLAGRMSAEDVQLFYQLAQGARTQVVQAGDPRAAFEMLALRLLAFRPVMPLDPTLSADDLSAPQDAPAAEVGGAAKKPEPPPAAPEQKPEADPEPKVEPAREAESDPQCPAPGAYTGAPWYEVLDSLGLSGSALNVASHCVIESVSGAQWQLVLDEGRANLFNDRHTAIIASALGSWAGEPVELNIRVAPVSVETPAARQQRRAKERLALAESEIKEDPRVLQLVDEFEAKLLQGSVTVEQP
jgi:DNA polymerase-3 subunit gamma/tau